MFRKRSNPRKVGWNHEATKYNELVGDKGHYFHDKVIIPRVLKILNLKPGDSLLDLGCGQGVFARRLIKEITYTGVDSSRALINIAKTTDKNKNHVFIEASATRPLKSITSKFSHALFLLSLQNMEYQAAALKNAYEHLSQSGKLLIVLNHPAFRIPRQSGWGEHSNKLQYRWVTRYLSTLKIPITMHPGMRSSAVTMSYHNPISFYVNELSKLGFKISTFEELSSDKVSTGPNSKMENRGRAEIPLFLIIEAQKL